MGIGSEGVARSAPQRRFLGTELKRAYFDQAVGYLAAATRSSRCSRRRARDDRRAAEREGQPARQARRRRAPLPNGERRSYVLLRPTDATIAGERLTPAILAAYAAHAADAARLRPSTESRA
jgi:hypothetical protein